MRKLLFIAAVLFPAMAFAQMPTKTDSIIYRGLADAGYALHGYQKTHTAGVALTILGGGITYFGVVGSAPEEAIYIGAAFGITGFILSQIVAPLKVRKAGLILTNTGLAIPLKRK